MRTIKGDHVILNISGWGDRDVDDILFVFLKQQVFLKQLYLPNYLIKVVLVENYEYCFFWAPQNV